MSITFKYFDQDKNYLLKTVQAFSKDRLLPTWTKQAYEGYLTQENPLGLEDDFTREVRTQIMKGVYILDEAYELLAAIYRFHHGDNQLSFLWDGRSHMQHYDEQWEAQFKEWTRTLSLQKEVYRGVIKAALDDGAPADFLKQSVRRAVLRHFQMRVSRRKKMPLLKIA